MSRPFRVHAFSPQALFDALANEHFSSSRVAEHPVAQYLCRYLEALNARTLIVEEQYVDRDYLEDYSSYYARCFVSYERLTRRLHFFSCDTNETAFLDVVGHTAALEDTDALLSSYLGFVVARPLPNAIVGRTILKTYPPDGQRRHFEVVRQYEANLYGAPLSVNSLAFQEQDTVLAACATVALWCAFQKTSELFASAQWTPSRITAAASEWLHVGRSVPSHGLQVQEMCNAVRAVGLEPELVELGGGIDYRPLVYAYLRYGVPVILGVAIGDQYHATTVTGYALRPMQRQASRPFPGSTPSVGDRIDELYVHDDQVGPFARCRIHADASGKRTLVYDRAWQDRRGRPQKVRPHLAIIPIYHKIRLRYVDVMEWVSRLDAFLSLLLRAPDAREWDIRLASSNEIKTSLAADGTLDIASLHRLVFRPYPRYVWRATLAVEAAPVVDVFLDATDLERALPVHDILWHDPALQDTVATLLRDETVQCHLRPVLRSRLIARLLDLMS